MSLQSCDVKMMNYFQRFSSCSVNTLYLVAYVSVAMFFGQVGGSGIGGPAYLRRQFVFLLIWPCSAQTANLDV